MNLRRRAAQLNLDNSFHQIENELLVWIVGCYLSIGVVSLVMQRHVARDKAYNADRHILSNDSYNAGGRAKSRGSKVSAHLHSLPRHRLFHGLIATASVSRSVSLTNR